MSEPRRYSSDPDLIKTLAKGILEDGWQMFPGGGFTLGPPLNLATRPTPLDWANAYRLAYETTRNELAEVRGEVAALELGNGELQDDLEEMAKREKEIDRDVHHSR